MADLSMAFDPSDISSVASDAASAASDALSKAAAASSKIIAQSSAWEADTGWTPTHLVTAYLSADQADITTDVETLVELDTEIMDVGSDFNTTTHLFTVPHTGYYLVSGAVGWKPRVNLKWHSVIIKASSTGTLCRTMHRTAMQYYWFSINVSKIVSLTASETVGLYCLHDEGVNTPDINSIQANTYLSILYLG